MQKNSGDVHSMLMSEMEKISESLRLAESKKNDLEKSILSLTVQWKDIVDELHLVQKDFCEAMGEIDAKKKRLNCEKESLQLRRELIERRVREIRDRERDFALFRDIKIRDLEQRENEFGRISEAYAKKVFEQEKRVEGLLKERGCGCGKDILEKGLKDLKSQRKGFEEEIKDILDKGLKDLESQRKGFGEEIEKFELRKKELEQSLMEFHSKNKDFLSQKKLLEEESGKLQQREEEFQHRAELFFLAEREFGESLKEFELRRTESLRRMQVLEMKSNDLELKEDQIERVEKLIIKECKHLDSWRKEVEESIKKIESREKEVGLKEERIGSEKMLLEKDFKQLESGRNELEDRIKNFELGLKELELKEAKSIGKEISALKKVIRLITRHNLQSEYSPDELRSTIKELESRSANLKAQRQKVDVKEEASLASDVQMLQQNKKRRLTSDYSYSNEANFQLANKFPRLVSSSQFSYRHPIQCEPPLSHQNSTPPPI